MKSAGGYCNAFLNVRSAIVNIDYRSIVQERVSGLGMAKSNISDHIESEVGNEAEEYVESIMGSQRIVRVNTPLVNSRKRQHSAPGSAGGEDIDHAEFLGESGNTPSPGLRKEVKKARRTIINEPSPPSTGGRLVVTGAEVHVSADTSVEQLINKLSTDVRSMFSDLSDRIDRLESGLEQRISKKVAQLLDKRVNAEMSRIKKDVDVHIDSVKDEISADIAEINERLKRIDNIKMDTPSPQPDISRNVIIHNLPESNSERIDSKVTGLLRDGLKLGSITVGSAERKVPQEGSNKPGVVVVTLKSIDDKKKIMSAKNKLKNHKRYSRVYINHDQSRSERLLADNFRAILSAVKNGDTNLTLRGARVIRTGSSSDRDSRDARKSSPPPPSRGSRRPGDRNSKPSSPSRSRDSDSRGDRSSGSAGRDDRRSHQRDSRNSRR